MFRSEAKRAVVCSIRSKPFRRRSDLHAGTGVLRPVRRSRRGEEYRVGAGVGLADLSGRPLTGIGLVRRAGEIRRAGTLVPITGFANAVCSIAIESRSEGYVTGVCADMFKIAGPVIVFGTSLSVIYGVIYYFCI